MLVETLGLRDFRSYDELDLSFETGVSLLLGGNGQGKTNLVEAIHRAATGTSHRVASDQPLVRMGADHAVIRLGVRTDAGRRRTLDLEVGGGSRRSRTKVDGHPAKRATDALGVLRLVVFAPEDLVIVRGSPSDRRGFLDTLLGMRRPSFVVAKSEFDRALRQRNHLLKQLRGLRGSAREAADVTLDVWSEQLVRHGSVVTAARIAAVHAMAEPVAESYDTLADRPAGVRLSYELSTGRVVVGASGSPVPDPAALAAELEAGLAERREDEIARGQSLVGPHRDDMLVDINDMPARTHASQGEAWSAALALRLGSYDLLHDVGDRPVVVLDDVFSELDDHRRRCLAKHCETFEQVLVTAAVAADVPINGRPYRVELTGDRVSRVEREP